MKRPFLQNKTPQSQSGVTMLVVALAMVATIGIAALSIDVITLYLAREEAQRSADAAALAAAHVISVSGMTGDTDNSSGAWTQVCGGLNSPATLAAVAVATQSPIGGTVTTVPTVKYSAGGQSPVTDCSGLPAAFGVNPLVTVKIQRTSLPTFFARIWGATSSSVSATATAEAFNPSASELNGNGATGALTPVEPTCVKPLLVPNQNPVFPSTTCNTGSAGACHTFVSPIDGAITDPGTQSSGVIGETFTLFADCGVGSPCSLPTAAPQANATGSSFTGGAAPLPPNLEYVPGEAPPFSVAVPSCATSGSGGNTQFEPAVAGCDQNTVYHCGAAGLPNVVDLTENPGGANGDSASGLACLINNDPTTIPLVGQDTLDVSSYPYRIKSGTANKAIPSGNFVTASNSIVSFPIYDPATFTVTGSNQVNVSIVGFLQVFVNQVNADGSITVTVLNVSGCGNGSATVNPAVTGNSPVPVRLITPP